MVRFVWSAYFAIIAVLVLLGAETAHAQGIDSYVDSNQIRLGETVEYIIDIEQNVRQVLPPESSGFRVVGQSTRTNVRVANGTVERTLSYRFRLSPTKVGTIPTGAARVRFPDGTMLRGTSFAIEVLDAQQTPPPSAARRQARSAPVRPQRAGVTDPTQGGGMKPSSPRTADDDLLPSMPPAGSGALFSSGLPADGVDGPFVVAMISDNEPYVGEQLIADYLLFSPVSGFGMNAQGLTEPEFTNFWFDDITEQRRANGRTSMIGTERVRGRLYEVHLLRSFLILPLDSGEAIVPPIDLTVSDSTLFGQQGTRDISSPPLQIDVRPLPTTDRPPGFRFGNVGRFTLTADVQPDAVKVGDTGRIQITVSGAGIASRVVAPEIELPDSVRQFPPDDRVNESISSTGWMRLDHTRTVAFNPVREGTVQLPTVAFSYFDPWSESYKTVEAELGTIDAQGVRAGYVQPDGSNTETSAPDAWLAGLPAERTLDTVDLSVSRLTPYRGRASFYTLLLAPFLLVFATAGIRGLREKRKKSAPTREKDRAGKTAKKQIAALDSSDTQSFSQLAHIIRRYIGIKSQRPTQGTTLKQVREIAGQHFGRTGFQLADIVGEAEHARFSGASTDDFMRLKVRASETIQAAEHALNHLNSEESP